MRLPAALREGVVVWDVAGRVLEADDEAAALLGDAPVLLELDGTPLNPERHPAARAARLGTRVDQEVALDHPVEGRICLAVRSAPAAHVTVVSALARVPAGEARARAAGRVAPLEHEAPDLVWILDDRGRIEYASRTVGEALGLDPAELVGGHWRDEVHPGDRRAAARRIMAATPEDPATPLMAARVRAADGWRWIEGRATVRFHRGAAETVELIARDVTARRAAEDERRRLAAHLEALVAAAPYGILIIDGEERVALVNEQASTLLGHRVAPGDHADALRAAFAGSIPAEQWERVATVSAGGEAARFIFVDLADGRRLSIDHFPLGDGGRVWTFGDVTEFKRVEQERAQAMAAKDEFLATMSHEIRTPLAGIAGAAELLLEAGLAERERGLARVIVDASHGLSGLLGGVLDVSRAEAVEVREESDYDIRELLESVAGVLRPSIGDRDLALVVDIDPSVPDVLHGEPARIRQIVLNLAGNAVKYTERGRVRIRATVGAHKLRIAVIDTGQGIDEANLARLFEPWTRAHGSAWDGSGLGLSIARRLAQALGGEITAASRLGRGSTFTLDLPLAYGAAPSADADAVPPLPGGGRVLVAEDDPALRSLLGMQLERLGAAPTLVADGRAAVEACDGGYDAVLLDLRMPVLGGLDAAREIRGREAAEGRRPVPILAITADTADADVARCREAGMDGHLGKPVSIAALRAELARRLVPVLDPARLDELAAGVGDALWTMLESYRAALPGRLDRLRAATGPDELRDAAHALRSPSASFGVARLATRLEAVERAAAAGRPAGLDGVLHAAAEADARISGLTVS